MTDPTLNIRAATPDDIDLLLALIHELATYEKAPEEAVATPELIEQALFGTRPSAEAVISEWNGQPAGDRLPRIAGRQTPVGMDGVPAR